MSLTCQSGFTFAGYTISPLGVISTQVIQTHVEGQIDLREIPEI